MLSIALTLALATPNQDLEPIRFEELRDFVNPTMQFMQVFGGYSTRDNLMLAFKSGTTSLVLSPHPPNGGIRVAELRARLIDDPEDASLHLDLSKALRERALEIEQDRMKGSSAARPEDELQMLKLASEHVREAELLLRFDPARSADHDRQLLYASALRSMGRGLESRELLEELAAEPSPSWQALLKLARLPVEDVFQHLNRSVTGTREQKQRELELAWDRTTRALELAPDRSEPYRTRVYLRLARLLQGAVSGSIRNDEVSTVAEGIREDLRRVRELAVDERGPTVACHFGESLLLLGMALIRMARAEGSPWSDLRDTANSAEVWARLEPVVRALPDHLTAEEKQALLESEEALRLYVDDEEFGPLASIGRVLGACALGEYEQAASLFAPLVTFGAQFAPIRDLIRFFPFVSARLLQEASGDESELLERLDIEYETAFPHNMLGFTFLDRGEPDRAVTQFRAAISKRPNDADAWMGLGVALYRRDGANDEARDSLERASRRRLRRASHLPRIQCVALLGLGLLRAESGELDAAIETLQRANRIDPDNPGAARVRGELLVLRALSDDARRPADLTNAAHAFLRAADRSANLAAMKKPPDGSPRPRVASSHREEALDSLRRAELVLDAIEQEPEPSRAWLRLTIERLVLATRLSVGGPAQDIRDALEASIDQMRRLRALYGLVGHEAIDLARYEYQLARGTRGSMDAALVAAQEAHQVTLGRDPAALDILAQVHLARGELRTALDRLEDSAAVRRQMHGEDTLHRSVEGNEQALLRLYENVARNDTALFRERAERIVSLVERRANRPHARPGDLRVAARLFLWPEAWYRPQRALELATSLVEDHFDTEPADRLLMSWALYRNGELDRSLDVVVEAFRSFRELTDEESGDKRVRFLQGLRRYLRADHTEPTAKDDGPWAANARRQLEPAELEAMERAPDLDPLGTLLIDR
ncbi:MAG: tetratricopeptide repeat protein [bacterium]|nr:tetratricopeptide repeat protein [bacterium]